MDHKQNNKSTSKTSFPQDKARKSYFYGGIIVFFIALTPLLFYSYNSFPSDSQTWETFLFTIDTNFPSIFHFAWYLVGKIVPLFLLFIWFFTCKHWWHWIILAPISMYTFQLWGIINQSNQVDEVEIYYILPMMMILVPSVYLIRAKLFDKVRGKNLAELEEELSKPMTLWDQFKDLFK